MGTGDQVKDQYVFTSYYAGYGFFGILDTLTTDSMYAVKSTDGGSLSVTGTPTALPKRVTLNAGWTWLPCPYQASLPLQIAAPTFAYGDGDQFKSQSQFTQYYAGYGFFGTLVSLEPGQGYKVHASTGGGATFESP